MTKMDQFSEQSCPHVDISYWDNPDRKRLKISLPDNLVDLAKNINKVDSCYCHYNKDMTYFPLQLGMFLKLCIAQGHLPLLIFIESSERDLFLNQFYNSCITYKIGQTEFCKDTVSEKFIIPERDYALNSIWLSPACCPHKKKARLEFSEISEESKMRIPICTLSEININDQFLSPSVIIVVKTISYEQKRRQFISYWDYEDKPKANPELGKKPIVIFVNDHTSLPRPEKLLKKVSRNERVFILAKDMQCEVPVVVSDNSSYGFEFQSKYLDSSFFDLLSFSEKRKFVYLFLRNIWGHMSDKGWCAPDAGDMEYFSADVSKQNKLSSWFVNIINDIRRSYFLSETRNALSSNKNQNFVSDLSLDLIEDYQKRKQCRLAMPSMEIFHKVYKFIFSKDLFYSKKEFRIDMKISPDLFSDIRVDQVQVQDNEEAQIPDIQEKLRLEENYGAKRNSLSDCRKLLLQCGSDKYHVFVPLNSDSVIQNIHRGGRKITKLKYSQLVAGDEIIRAYWTYEKLVRRLKDSEHWSELGVRESVEISENFRTNLQLFLEEYGTLRAAMNVISCELHNMGFDEHVNYQTILSWISDVMCPAKISKSKINALLKIFSKKKYVSVLSGADEFMRVSKNILGLRDKFAEEAHRDATIHYTVLKVLDGQFKVRGENVGKIYRIT